MANYRKSVKVRVPSVDADLMRLDKRVSELDAEMLGVVQGIGAIRARLDAHQDLITRTPARKVEEREPPQFVPWKRHPEFAIPNTEAKALHEIGDALVVLVEQLRKLCKATK